jgi:uncharacterized protein
VLQATGSFTNGGTSLSYAVDLPQGSPPYPAVVLVHGSGPVTKESLLPLSRRFTALGYAVLRFDKRGVGGSGGVYSGVSVTNSALQLQLLAGDAAAAVKLLGRRADMDAKRIGLVGASQAGWIIPIASGLATEIRFAVVLSGPTTSVGLEIFFSDLAELTSTPLAEVLPKLDLLQGAHGFDPIETLRTDRVPTLWLYGIEDRSIPVQRCMEIHQTLRQQYDVPFTVRAFPGVGHALSPTIWPEVQSWLRGLRL